MARPPTTSSSTVPTRFTSTCRSDFTAVTLVGEDFNDFRWLNPHGTSMRVGGRWPSRWQTTSMSSTMRRPTELPTPVRSVSRGPKYRRLPFWPPILHAVGMNKLGNKISIYLAKRTMTSSRATWRSLRRPWNMDCHIAGRAVPGENRSSAVCLQHSSWGT